jgi:DNA polymerase III subunit delta
MIFKSYIVEENLKKLNKNLILFYGENLGLMNEFKKKIIAENKDAEIIKFNQDEIIKNENLFLNEIYNISLFEKKKIYFLNQTNDKIINLIEEIQTKLGDQKLYVFSDILDKRSKLRNYFEKSENCGAVACYPDNEISIKKIIYKKLEGFEGLSAQNINMLADNCGLNRIKLNNELDKIVSYFVDKKIENNKLEELLDYNTSDDFNALKDEALNGNKSKTNKLLSNTIINTEKSVYYLASLNQRLNKLYETCKHIKSSNLDDAINSIKPPVFWKDKATFKIQATKWNLNKIKKILNETYNLEIRIKSNSQIDKSLLMKKLLIDVCKMANS